MKLFSVLRPSTLVKAVLPVIITLGVCVAFPQNEPSAAKKKDPRSYDYTELAKAPEKARVRPNPLADDPDAVAAGRKLFEGHCAECHGDTAEGTKKAPSLRVDAVQQATPGAVFWLLTNGVVRRGMPVWSKLPEPQRWQIVSYIKSLTPSQKQHE